MPTSTPVVLYRVQFKNMLANTLQKSLLFVTEGNQRHLLQVGGTSFKSA
ncbi:hypothetical protein I8751_03270 [Nostocaceae cyanobacterium CENA357]|uniref:Uncharacterized protein n=1 Tax=Atlanticothrix silvestris CENA357 TaxID=1725252 RepID=A0A8J7HE29_9CYAN|nr:hypothetical protein [Atlanticothrix silvestris CENA357]